ncbi:MAG: MFS transporter [Phycisphaerae bacterium]|nr:MFS transporter [Phycisphaerae bacterium]
MIGCASSPVADLPSNTLGLRENLSQFLLLTAANCFVGGVVGAQRSVLPMVGGEYFGLASATALTSFVVSFGIVKACTNLVAGRLADRIGRRNVLLLGWAAAAPIPFMIAVAADRHAWWMIVAANVLLGINQGLCWTMTVVMKVDLVGARRRGLALGVNESAGYTFVALAAFLVALMATEAMPLRGIIILTGVFVGAGFCLSLIFVRDTEAHLEMERARDESAPRPARVPRARLAASQAGLLCNLNDAVIWTTLPPFLAALRLDAAHVGFFAALYPGIWGLSQLVTGALSDRFGRTRLIIIGMFVQGAGHIVLGFAGYSPMIAAAGGCTLLGIGTALAYPSLLAFVADQSLPMDRSKALGSYRFFRDMGYAAGALGAGAMVDAAGFAAAIHVSGAVTILSGVVFMTLIRPGAVSPGGR